ncbi:Integrase family protein (fragment) [Desulfosarcina cetonica]
MKLSTAATIPGSITTRTIRKKHTLRSYQAIIEPFYRDFGDRVIGKVTPDEILSFLNRLTDGNKPYTKRVRFSQLSCFFNFVRNNIDYGSVNPCDTPMIWKLYRQEGTSRWEIIFRTTKIRNRLLLELMVRGGMRVGEVLKIRL